MPKEEGRVQLMFVGISITNDVVYGRWAEVDDIPNDGREINVIEDHFNKPTVTVRKYDPSDGKRKKWLPMCGQIYSFKRGGNDTSIVYSDRRYVDLWKNEGQRITWQTLFRSAEITFDAEQKGDKIKFDFSELEPIAAAYAQAVGVQKHIILAEVVKYITGYRRRSKK